MGLGDFGSTPGARSGAVSDQKCPRETPVILDDADQVHADRCDRDIGLGLGRKQAGWDSLAARLGHLPR
jgi:hypothetical protein